MTLDYFYLGVSDLYEEGEQGEVGGDETYTQLKEKLEDFIQKQGEAKVKIARLQQNLDQWVTTGTIYFDEIVALKRERTELKNERDTWKGRHQALKSAIGTATQASNLDAATYG